MGAAEDAKKQLADTRVYLRDAAASLGIECARAIKYRIAAGDAEAAAHDYQNQLAAAQQQLAQFEETYINKDAQLAATEQQLARTTQVLSDKVVANAIQETQLAAAQQQLADAAAADVDKQQELSEAYRDRDDYTAAEADRDTAEKQLADAAAADVDKQQELSEAYRDRDTAEKQLAEYKQLALTEAAAGQVFVCKLELQLEAAQLAATANARGARQAAAEADRDSRLIRLIREHGIRDSSQQQPAAAETADSRLIQRNAATIAHLRQRIDAVDCRLADTRKELWNHIH